MSETTQVTGAAQATTDAAPTSSAAAAAPAAPAAGSTPPAAQQQTEPVAKADAPAGESKDATKTDEVPPAKVVPEQYEDFKQPEGLSLDPELTTEFKTIAKELQLSQDEAQKVSDIGAKLVQKMAAQQKDAVEQLRNAWDTATKTDKEFGGDKLKSSLVVAERALNEFGTPELFKLLDESGLRKHPEIIRAFYRAGKAISDDRIVPAGTRPNQGGVDAAKVLYPNN